MAIKYKVTNGRYSALVAKPVLRLKYVKGKITKAQEGTIGIAVFDTMDQATRFAARWACGDPFKIRRVRSIGRKRTLTQRCLNVDLINRCYLSLSFERLLDVIKRDGIDGVHWPKGTSFYSAVEVLD